MPELLLSLLFLWSCLRYRLFLIHSSCLLVYQVLLRNVLVIHHPSILLTGMYTVMFYTCYPLWDLHWMPTVCHVGRLLLLPARLRSFFLEWTDVGKPYVEGNNHINIDLQSWLALHSRCPSLTSSDGIIGSFLKEVMLIRKSWDLKMLVSGHVRETKEGHWVLAQLEHCFWKQGLGPFVGLNWGRCGCSTQRVRSD